MNPAWLYTQTGRVRLCEDGIVQVEISSSSEQTPEHARANLTLAMTVCGEERRPILVDVRGTQPLRKETRLVYSDPGVSKVFLGLGMVTLTDTLSRLMINVYFQAARLSIPTRMFNDPAAARVWLTGLMPRP